MSTNSNRFLDPKNDFAFKRIFGREENKDILITFLNDVLDHEHIGQIQEVALLPTIQDPEIASKKQSILDILCRDQNGVQYIIEMQVARSKGFEKRAQFYAAKAYSTQLMRAGQYQDLKEVIFLAITDFVMYPDQEDIKSDHIILDKKTLKHKLKDIYFTFIELPKFTKKIDELENDTERWYFYLKNADQTQGPDYEKLTSAHPIIKRAYHEVDKAYWSETELNTYEAVLKRERDNKAARAQALDDAQKKGIAIGEERGMAIGKEVGKEEGIAIGEAKSKQVLARQMLQEGLARSLVSKITGLSEAVLQDL